MTVDQVAEQSVGLLFALCAAMWTVSLITSGMAWVTRAGQGRT